MWSITQETWPHATIKGISRSTALLADSWKTLQGEGYRRSRAIWDWEPEFKSYQTKPKRFEMSIWSGSELCGLTYGSLSKNGSKVRMNLIEATPVRPSPLGEAVFPILSFGATVYADLVGADEIWLLDPVSGAIDYYKNQGYMAPERYCGKRIGMKKR
ncbi:hypothetical protein GZ78_14865 [Endozoicomonas numazuensis]|uniref:N-acetyltransferase domain-containing protein n=1 Tax=Endozoicomonas numazuensis TaxID=1137799 RepID=A0A081NFC0_9GAMM|nr:hypothetical protein GZ78_14865 [Endozoicomonas numazuensis]